jgi:hypothetical protein
LRRKSSNSVYRADGDDPIGRVPGDAPQFVSSCTCARCNASVQRAYDVNDVAWCCAFCSAATYCCASVYQRSVDDVTDIIASCSSVRAYVVDVEHSTCVCRTTTPPDVSSSTTARGARDVTRIRDTDEHNATRVDNLDDTRPVAMMLFS